MIGGRGPMGACQRFAGDALRNGTRLALSLYPIMHFYIFCTCSWKADK